MDVIDEKTSETFQKNIISDEVSYDISDVSKKTYENELACCFYSDCVSIIIQYLIWDVKKGEIIGVYYPGTEKWHIGVILKHNSDQIFIHYLGWGEKWNEWKSLNEVMPYDHRLNCDNVDHTEYDFFLDRLLRVKKGEKSTIQINKGDEVITGEIIDYPFENGIWNIEYNTINKYHKIIKNKINYDELIRYSAYIQLNNGYTIYNYLFGEREYKEPQLI